MEWDLMSRKQRRARIALWVALAAGALVVAAVLGRAAIHSMRTHDTAGTTLPPLKPRITTTTIVYPHGSYGPTTSSSVVPRGTYVPTTTTIRPRVTIAGDDPRTVQINQLIVATGMEPLTAACIVDGRAALAARPTPGTSPAQGAQAMVAKYLECMRTTGSTH